MNSIRVFNKGVPERYVPHQKSQSKQLGFLIPLETVYGEICP